VSEAGVTATGVVAVQAAECVEAGFALAGPVLAILERLRLNVALKDWASALSAELPIALMD
jgi:hypothetical protein